ncbi:xanthine dehydrogenase small subunit [Microbulbifer celer]|uniref:Xanthine dehydrogenase small subunit n=1 Tax=Microbulbifer celer TaxID=435905 RepID=A0ABW3U6L9_9GAMM|nr:xanthine dehydrogenase small subunit [Microbulbifer celer]UFN57729.1 xanthine dehydrogenase small subunit [Microbulbifer celer]
MIEFYLNGRHQQLASVDPNLTVLEWLRTQARLTGTKEGCASGDCGACTVAIGSLEPSDQKSTGTGDRLRYDAVNSCIALVGSLHGKHLISVDGLQTEPAHPVQKEMVECHGAQCGFCTPGIIMSLFALHTESVATGKTSDDAALMESLSGNLCRCTGYRPIVEAGRKAAVQSWEPADGAEQKTSSSEIDLRGPAWLQHPDMIATLKQVQNKSVSITAESGRRYDAPNSLEQLRQLRAEFPEARLVAGATDLSLEITQLLRDLEHVIGVNNIPELQQIREQQDGLYLGAAASYRAAQHALASRWPHFHTMLERLGSLQIRNRGTVGGNIGNASPIGDMPPALIALGAELELDSVDGVRRLPIQDFFHDYKKTDLRKNEFIRGVWIPAPAADEQLLIYKISKRLDDDISAVLGAFWFRLDGAIVEDCRLAFGGMAAIPKRAAHAENALRGQPWTLSTVANAIAALDRDFTPMSDVRSSAAYRQQVAGNLLRRALLDSARSDFKPVQHHDQNQKKPLMVTEYA